ncbi:MAG: hypothetical protein ACC634_02220 [Hyphomicrobiales bacterium]
MSGKAFTAIGVFVVVIGAAVISAVATDAPRAQGAPDRFLVTPIEGGIMRVDRQTGEVSVCKERQGKWNCGLVPDDRQALEREIIDLERNNARLSQGDIKRGHRSDQRQAEQRRAREYDDMEDDGGFMSPEEVDKAMNSVERMMERFIETARKLRRRMAEEDNTNTR